MHVYHFPKKANTSAASIAINYILSCSNMLPPTNLIILHQSSDI